MSVKNFRCSLIIILGFALVREVVFSKNCFKLKFLSVRTSDTKFYRLSATLNEDSTLTVITNVLKDVPGPMWKFAVIEYLKGTTNTKIHFNGLLNTCDWFKTLNNIRILRQLVTPIFKDPKKGNFSFDCPFRVGVYVLKDVDVPAQSGAGIMKYTYKPNSIYLISFKVVQRLTKNKMEKLGKVEMNSTITEIC
ncbi:uncharacterized protein LOC129947776 [Eupeodes corollae]|uniref:uncharacterized protein LOC129947776 n=1 Tax=Eupeodes corollae TaxID=290404 RepID=UPI002492137F|nr:uncharacterized protein LOC129947776 [Eupeodes corollae]